MHSSFYRDPVKEILHTSFANIFTKGTPRIHPGTSSSFETLLGISCGKLGSHKVGFDVNMGKQVLKIAKSQVSFKDCRSVLSASIWVCLKTTYTSPQGHCIRNMMMTQWIQETIPNFLDTPACWGPPSSETENG